MMEISQQAKEVMGESRGVQCYMNIIPITIIKSKLLLSTNNMLYIIFTK